MQPDESAPLTHDRDRADGLSLLGVGEIDAATLNADHCGGRRLDGYLWASASGARHLDPGLVKHPPDTR
jgi:hypothetical protein